MTMQSRREFVKAATAGAAALAGGDRLLAAVRGKRYAWDRVKLGNSGVTVTRLGLGTGSHNGRVQRELGVAGLERLFRHAYDQGIRFIDTADQYQIHEMVGQAIKGLPREKIAIQTKMRWQEKPKDPLAVIDRFRRELKTDYLDSLLIHCTVTEAWPRELEYIRDAFSKAKEKGIVKSQGVTVHGLPPLRAATTCDWVDIQQIRVNPQGRHVDNEENSGRVPGNVSTVVGAIKKMHAAGRGLIGMKIIGNGDFKDPADREKSIRFAMKLEELDAVVIGFGSTQELDEAVKRMNRALNA